MSDAISDMYRDQRRQENYEMLMTSILEWIENDFHDEGKSKILKDALELDDVRGGFSTSRTSYSSKIANKIDALKNNDAVEWSRFIVETSEIYSIKQRVIAASPFSSKISIPVSVRYGSTLNIDSTELQILLGSALRNLELSSNPNSKFVIHLDRDIFSNAEIVQISKGQSRA